MRPESKKYYIQAAHALQPQRRLYHNRFSTVGLDPNGTDWIGKITQECYEPLAVRYGLLAPDVHLSIDFYGILRMQMKDHPKVIKEVFRGLKANGMGDSYIHPILPFLDDRDKAVLIGAGRKALEKEGVKPNVFWAPESALDRPTLNVLRDFDYRAVLLHPDQVRRSDGKSADNYPLRLDNNMIAIPFDQKIHREISFGDIDNADVFASAVIYPKIDNSELGFVLGHTDIETFGHHRKGADQFLDRLLKVSLGNNCVELISIDQLLQKLKDNKYEIPKGELVENRSWSCPHGLRRWREGCDCEGGWEWKSGFLGVFLWLNDQVRVTVDREFGGNTRRIDSQMVNNFEKLLLNPGGSSSNKDNSLYSARVDGLSSLQSCSTFFGDVKTSGWGSIGLGLEAIEHVRDAGLVGRSNSLRDEYLRRLGQVQTHNVEPPFDVAKRMLGGG